MSANLDGNGKEIHLNFTEYHARYFAHALTLRRPSADVDRLSTSLFNATVDLNPHQIDAALFALKSPLSKGVLLADEVGLGKTIEAALILCQYWAERRRRLLVVCPASIRKQWSLELEEKFNLPTTILDSVAYRRAQADGNPAPFLTDGIVITSLNFASAMQADVRAVPWDVVVIDEAHKLRNAYRPSNQMGQRLRWALEDRRKVLLTATPLQNSLLELYGLSTVIDEHIFGDIGSFRSQYMRQDSDLKELRERLAGFCKRTLRNQVTEYIQYTERHPLTRPFQPTDGEHKFYEAVSAFLLRDDTYSIPVRQRALTTLILRKLLASSSHAIAGTLETMKERLEKIRDGQPTEENLAEQIIALEELQVSNCQISPTGLSHTFSCTNWRRCFLPSQTNWPLYLKPLHWRKKLPLLLRCVVAARKLTIAHKLHHQSVLKVYFPATRFSSVRACLPPRYSPTS
jgi:hypothetical protein